MPDILLTDFDRTLGYLYQSPNLLYALKAKVVASYREFAIPKSVSASLSDDGYLAWHQLHDWVRTHVDPDTSLAANRRAESVVTEFEVRRVEQTTLLPGVTEAIHRVEGTLPMGVVSSNSGRAVELALRRAGVAEAFSYIGGRPIEPFDPALLKPNSFQIQLAIDFFSAAPSRVWYIGDDVIDIAASHSAGAVAVGVASGKYSASALSDAGADLVFDTFGQASAALIDTLSRG